MPGLFKKAAAKAATAQEGAPRKKSTQWFVGDERSTAVATSVHELVVLNAQAKAIEAKMGVHKTIVKSYAEGNFLADYAALGVTPDTPMIVQNQDGEKVTFVCQDRSSQAAVKEEQRTALEDLLGADGARSVLYDEVSFGFNRAVLAVPGVQEAVEAALEKAIKKLVDDGTLSPEQTELLLDVDTKTAFKPGTFGQLALVCGKDVGKMKRFLDIAGSAHVRYIKT